MEGKKRTANRYWVEINGKIYARLQYKAANGKYRVKYEPITDKRKARTVVERLRTELETHGEELLNAANLTFGELSDRYEKAELIEATYQAGTKVTGRRSVGSVRSAIKPLKAYFGQKPIASIRPSDIKAFKHERLATPVEREVNVKHLVLDAVTGRKKTLITKDKRQHPRKIATVNRELAALRAMLNFAIDNNWLVSNPFTKAKGVISISAETERNRVLSFAEEERLLSACVNIRSHIKPILVCALDTAMRRGELFKMRWHDVKFSTGEIHIPQTNTKTEDARSVAMTPRLREELQQLWGVSPKDPSGLVFGIKTNITKSWSSVCHEANVVDFRFHDCRHTATTRMIASGSPHTEVMKITGHSQIKTFLRYLTITPETANRVANRLSDYINAQRPSVDAPADYIN